MKLFKTPKRALRKFIRAGRFNLFLPKGAVALPNALGLFNENGIETLLLDPASTYNSGNPWPGRGLIVQRGASGYQYGDLCAGGAGGALPLGTSLDAPYASGDPFNIRRFNARPGLEVCIATGAVTIDNLLVCAAGGKVQDFTTVVGNGTYWAIGRAASTVAATSSTMEVVVHTDFPWQIVLTGGTWSYPAAPK